MKEGGFQMPARDKSKDQWSSVVGVYTLDKIQEMILNDRKPQDSITNYPNGGNAQELFLTRPDNNGTFTSDPVSHSLSRTHFYKMYKISDTEAYYEFSQDPEALAGSLDKRQININPGTQQKNMFDSEAQKITTIKLGKLRLENGKWGIDQPAEIYYHGPGSDKEIEGCKLRMRTSVDNGGFGVSIDNTNNEGSIELITGQQKQKDIPQDVGQKPELSLPGVAVNTNEISDDDLVIGETSSAKEANMPNPGSGDPQPTVVYKPAEKVAPKDPVKKPATTQYSYYLNGSPEEDNEISTNPVPAKSEISTSVTNTEQQTQNKEDLVQKEKAIDAQFLQLKDKALELQDRAFNVNNNQRLPDGGLDPDRVIVIQDLYNAAKPDLESMKNLAESAPDDKRESLLKNIHGLHNGFKELLGEKTSGYVPTQKITVTELAPKQPVQQEPVAVKKLETTQQSIESLMAENASLKVDNEKLKRENLSLDERLKKLEKILLDQQEKGKPIDFKKVTPGEKAPSQIEIPPTEKTKITIGVVDATQLAQGEALDRAMDNAAEPPPAEAKGWFRTKIDRLKKNIFAEYYRNRDIKRVERGIRESNQIYEDPTDDAAAKNAVVSRFIAAAENTMGELRFTGETHEKATGQLKTDLTNIFWQFANDTTGNLSEDALSDRIIQRIRAHKGQTGKNDESWMAYATNTVEGLRALKQQLEHDKNIKRTDIDLEFIIGEARSAVKTEEQLSSLNKLVDKLKKKNMVLGALFDEHTIANAVYLAAGVGSYTLKKKAALFGLGAVAGAVIAGSKENLRHKRDAVNAKRRFATEGINDISQFANLSDRNRRMSEAIIHESTLSALDVIDVFQNSIDLMRQNPQAVTPEVLNDIVMNMAQYKSRRNIAESPTNRVDTFVFSGRAQSQGERAKMDMLYCTLIAQLRQMPNQASLLGRLQNSSTTIEQTIRGNVSEKQGIENKLRNNAVARKGIMSVVNSLTMGIVTDETMAFFSDHKIGLVESGVDWMRDHESGAPGDKSMTMLMGAWRNIGHAPSYEVAPPDMGSTYKLATSDVHMPRGYTLHSNLDGSQRIMIGDVVVRDNLVLTPGATGYDQTINQLKSEGFEIQNTVAGAESGNGAGLIDHREFIQQNQNYFQKAIFDGDKYFINSGRSADWHQYNGNELRMDAAKVVDGKYSMSIARMFGYESWVGNSHVNPEELAKAGNLKLMFDLGSDYTNKGSEGAFFVDVDAKGNAIIDPGHPMAKVLFHEENGHLVPNYGRVCAVVDTVDAQGVHHVQSLARDVTAHPGDMFPGGRIIQSIGIPEDYNTEPMLVALNTREALTKGVKRANGVNQTFGVEQPPLIPKVQIGVPIETTDGIVAPKQEVPTIDTRNNYSITGGPADAVYNYDKKGKNNQDGPIGIQKTDYAASKSFLTKLFDKRSERDIRKAEGGKVEEEVEEKKTIPAQSDTKIETIDTSSRDEDWWDSIATEGDVAKIATSEIATRKNWKEGGSPSIEAFSKAARTIETTKFIESEIAIRKEKGMYPIDYNKVDQRYIDFVKESVKDAVENVKGTDSFRFDYFKSVAETQKNLDLSAPRIIVPKFEFKEGKDINENVAAFITKIAQHKNDNKFDEKEKNIQYVVQRDAGMTKSMWNGIKLQILAGKKNDLYKEVNLCEDKSGKVAQFMTSTDSNVKKSWVRDCILNAHKAADFSVEFI